MKVSLKWLSKYVDISKLTPEELSSIISKAGTEIEEIAYFAKGSNLVVGEVIECEDIEGTHLHLCKVDIKDEVLQIVCGAKNVEKGKLVVVAMIGTIMNDGSFINKGQLKGYDSYGMLCSKRELNIPTEEVRGLYLLDPNEYNVGDLFKVN